MWIVQAWIKGSPNVVPVAQGEFQSIDLADDTAKLWRRQGFQIERFFREDGEISERATTRIADQIDGYDRDDLGDSPDW